MKLLCANRLNNAWKFTGKEHEAIIEFGIKKSNGSKSPTYFLRDNGVGFDMEYMNKLCKLFHRLHAEDEFTGTGIGLAIVKRVFERHDGDIWAESKINEGATFYFTLDNQNSGR